ncbi:hypothetical protein BE17_52400 [Sorangium cellulosum]|uniref:Uncharacterized protein n=1 Tax=Sorangium cellulosum TaxID=56 RepID=A0A150R881_SORCE|nr:hypothetical protein BE17_52400 [Sorangium cellulosum]
MRLFAALRQAYLVPPRRPRVSHEISPWGNPKVHERRSEGILSGLDLLPCDLESDGAGGERPEWTSSREAAALVAQHRSTYDTAYGHRGEDILFFARFSGIVAAAALHGAVAVAVAAVGLDIPPTHARALP